MVTPLSQTPRIWTSESSSAEDVYRLFRREFECDTNTINNHITLYISADSTYTIWLNGQRLPINQAADFPKRRTYIEYNINDYIQNGNNIICIEVHYLGHDFLTYQVGEPFLAVAIMSDDKTILQSDAAWHWLAAPWYHQSLQCLLDGQLGFVFCRDCRKDDDSWLTASHDDGSWKPAVEQPELSRTQTIIPRGAPTMSELPPPPSRIVQVGYLKRFGDEGNTFAQNAYRDYLSPRRLAEAFAIEGGVPQRGFGLEDITFKDDGTLYPLASSPDESDGYYVIYDLGCETVGYIKLTIDAPAGTAVDICHGEHLDDGRVRAWLRGSNFADRVICGDGVTKVTYTHRRLGCRYIELHITGAAKGTVRLGYAGLIPLEIPLPPASEFHSDDRLLAQINRLSINTLKLCMHEHYEDCPWREQSLYAYDSRNQMLYGYYIWGNYNYAQYNLGMLGDTWDGRRQLAMVAPGLTTRWGFFTIPIFTLVWISALRDNLLFSGSEETFRKYSNVVSGLLDGALEDIDREAPGLYSPGDPSYIWNFYEWSPGLAQMKGGRQSLYNIYLVEALEAGAWLFGHIGQDTRASRYQQTANDLKNEINKYFWNKEMQHYIAQGEDTETGIAGYEHIQVLALANGIVPKECQEPLLRQFQSGTNIPTGINTLYYMIKAFTERNILWRNLLDARLKQLFEKMALVGATSLWETAYGGDDDHGTGSLCHGWSCAIPYYCGKVTLGVSPVEPGFAKFQVRPYSNTLGRASGDIPTPHGPIHVKWTKGDSGLDLTVIHPAGTTAILSPFDDEPIAKFNDITQ